MKTNISYFENISATPSTITIEDFCFGVGTGYWKEQVLTVRTALNKAEAKKQLPAVTISGVFEGRRKVENLTEKTGFICIDIDQKENEGVKDWDTLKKAIGKTAYFTAYSASGKGLFVIYRYNPKRDIKEVFNFVQQYYNSRGIVIDAACSDITRLRFVSFDPEAIWNPDKGYLLIRKVLNGFYKSKKFVAEKGIQRSETNRPPSEGLTLDTLKNWTERKKGTFTEGRRNTFIFTLAAAAHRFGMDFNDTLSYCYGYEERGFTRQEIEQTVKSVYNNESYRGIAKKEGISSLNKDRIKLPKNSLKTAYLPQSQKDVRVASSENPCPSLYQKEQTLTQGGVMQANEQRFEPYLPPKIEKETNETLKEAIKQKEEGVLVSPPNYFTESTLVQSLKGISGKWFEPKEKTQEEVRKKSKDVLLKMVNELSFG